MKVQIISAPNGYVSFKTKKYRLGDIFEIADKDSVSLEAFAVEVKEPVVVPIVEEAPVNVEPDYIIKTNGTWEDIDSCPEPEQAISTEAAKEITKPKRSRKKVE